MAFSRRIYLILIAILISSAPLVFSSCAGNSIALIAIELNPLCVQGFLSGQTQQFNACIFIDGVKQPGFDNAAVTWSIFGGDVNGSITQDGFYTAPNTDPPPTDVVTIIATSKEDDQKMGEASVIFINRGECEAFTTEECL